MRAPASFTRASNSRWRGVWGPGMNSSLETDCTGMGEANSDSALLSRASSSGDSMPVAILRRSGGPCTLAAGCAAVNDAALEPRELGERAVADLREVDACAVQRVLIDRALRRGHELGVGSRERAEPDQHEQVAAGPACGAVDLVGELPVGAAIDGGAVGRVDPARGGAGSHGPA